MFRFSDYLTAKIAFSLRRRLVMRNSFLSISILARTTTDTKNANLLFSGWKFHVASWQNMCKHTHTRTHAHGQWSDGEHDDSHFELKPLEKKNKTRANTLFSRSPFLFFCWCSNMSSRYVWLVLFSSLLFKKCVSLWVIVCLNHNHFGVIYIRNWQF